MLGLRINEVGQWRQGSGWELSEVNTASDFRFPLKTGSSCGSLVPSLELVKS